MSTLLSKFDLFGDLLNLYHGSSPLIKETRIELLTLLLPLVYAVKQNLSRWSKYLLEALQDQQLHLYNNLLDLGEQIKSQLENSHFEKQGALFMAKELKL